mgnify:FL=1
MIAINCTKCKTEFKLSRAELDERHIKGILDLCRVCIELKLKKKTIVKKNSTTNNIIKLKGK